METKKPQKLLEDLQSTFSGDLYTSDLWRIIYATDASAYRQVPLGVARPRDIDDLKTLIALAGKHFIPLIPRTAGTSLAGQVVGNGLIVDVSRYMTRILEINKEEHWARVQPGVILDELNKVIEPYGLFFGPETSTSSRCMIGGMVGNNSCGAHSILYGSTRDHLISVKTILTDGSEVEFKAIPTEEFYQKTKGDTLESQIYRTFTNYYPTLQTRRRSGKNFPSLPSTGEIPAMPSTTCLRLIHLQGMAFLSTFQNCWPDRKERWPLQLRSSLTLFLFLRNRKR